MLLLESANRKVRWPATIYVTWMKKKENIYFMSWGVNDILQGKDFICKEMKTMITVRS